MNWWYGVLTFGMALAFFAELRDDEPSPFWLAFWLVVAVYDAANWLGLVK